MTSPMTPTEQDKELKIAIAKVMADYGVDFYEGNLMHRTEQRDAELKGQD